MCSQEITDCRTVESDNCTSFFKSITNYIIRVLHCFSLPRHQVTQQKVCLSMRNMVYPFTFELHSVIHNSALHLFCSIIFIPTAWCHCVLFCWLLLLVLFVTGISVSCPISQTKILLFLLHLHLSAHAFLSDSHMHCRSTHRTPRYPTSLSFCSLHSELYVLGGCFIAQLLFHVVKAAQWMIHKYVKNTCCYKNPSACCGAETCGIKLLNNLLQCCSLVVTFCFSMKYTF